MRNSSFAEESFVISRNSSSGISPTSHLNGSGQGHGNAICVDAREVSHEFILQLLQMFGNLMLQHSVQAIVSKYFIQATERHKIGVHRPCFPQLELSHECIDNISVDDYIAT